MFVWGTGSEWEREFVYICVFHAYVYVHIYSYLFPFTCFPLYGENPTRDVRQHITIPPPHTSDTNKNYNAIAIRCRDNSSWTKKRCSTTYAHAGYTRRWMMEGVRIETWYYMQVYVGNFRSLHTALRATNLIWSRNPLTMSERRWAVSSVCVRERGRERKKERERREGESEREKERARERERVRECVCVYA